MENDSLHEGRWYAYREKRSTSEPFLKIKLLEKVGRRGKLRVRFASGPHPGLEDYVTTRQIVAPWGDRHAVLSDEKHDAALTQHAKGDSDPALGAAASAVLAATGESGGSAYSSGTSMPVTEVQRIMDRAGLKGAPADLHRLAYVDRTGYVNLPLEATVALARAFAAAEPGSVVAYIDDQEEELRLQGNRPGERWYHEYLRQQAPGFAIARQWAGLEAEAELLRKEIGRLRVLVTGAASELRSAGQEAKADTLQRALDGY